MQSIWFPSAVALILVSLLACDAGQPTVEPTGSTTTTSPPATSEPAEPVPDGCQVLLVLEAEGANGRLDKMVMLQARAKNLTATPLELTLEDRCPGGEAQFLGLESVQEYYDYYHTCTMGACMPGPPRVIELPPGEIVDISSTQIDPDGGMPCGPPIPAGTYELSFSLPLAEGSSNPVMCGPEPLVLRRK